MNSELDMELKQQTSSSVVVLYEDLSAREHAVQFCDCLVERFWKRCAFEIDWWGFDLLSKPEPARQAHEKALRADWVVFALSQTGQLSLQAKVWIEKWLVRRADRQEGTLVGLLPENMAADDTSETKIYLRNVAHRAGMDYLTKVPQAIAHTIPDSLDSYSERAQCVTGVLDEILHHRCKPPMLNG